MPEAPQRLVELVPSHAPARYVVRCGQLATEVDDDFNKATLLRRITSPYPSYRRAAS